MDKISIVITGSTRGIGLGLAVEFLKRDCLVVINGRSQVSVERAIESLQDEFDPSLVSGASGDVSDPQTHKDIWNTAVTTFGKVNIWINNAGLGHPMLMIWELPEETVNQVVDINVKGLIFGSQVAVRGMMEQGFGHIYNMEGFGSSGRMRPGISLYGTTKTAVNYFSKALTAEARNTPVKISTLRPGMVVTDMITSQYDDDPQGLENVKKILNMIGDKVETVTPWLVDKILRNEKSGAKINWLTTSKLFYRFATARFVQRDLFS